MARKTKKITPSIEDETRADIAIGQADESTYIATTKKPSLGKRVRELGQTKQRFYSEKVTDMQDLDTFNRFQASFRSSKSKAMASEGDSPKKGDDKTPPVSHTDPRVRKAIHGALKAIHRHVFENKNVKDMATAKERHAAVVALSEPDGDDGKK